jgi:hypothetical protein
MSKTDSPTRTMCSSPIGRGPRGGHTAASCQCLHPDIGNGWDTDGDRRSRDPSQPQRTEPACGRRTASEFLHLRSRIVATRPAAGVYHPAISAQRAYESFQSGPGGAFMGSTTPAPEVFLALYSTIGYGPGIGNSNPNAMGWNKVPVWVIRFTDFPSYPSGAGDTSGSSADVDQAPAHDDLVGVLRSNDGRILGLYQDVPDNHATQRRHG